jgi:uncharacterized protein YbgA (DUF1722 family)/uncharacterized protein YbbK (DUF523 family)
MSEHFRPSFARPSVVVSKCLGFDACRYNAQTVPDKFVTDLAPYVDYRVVCPEVEIGLGVPREPIRIVAIAEDDLRLMQPATMNDVTEEMRAFTQDYLDAVADQVDGFILKNRSPSCGLSDVKVYSSTKKGRPLQKTQGFFGGAVRDRFSGLAIEDEGRLKNKRLRQHFLTKLFALAQLRQLGNGKAKMADLVQFHAENKYLLMGYDQQTLKEMGQLVANTKTASFEELFGAYRQRFQQALSEPPACGSNINVLMHTIGHLKNQLAPAEKAFFLDTLRRYRAAQIPFSVPLNMMKAYVIRFEEAYLLQQTFFQPFPAALVDLADSGKVPECFLPEG